MISYRNFQHPIVLQVNIFYICTSLFRYMFSRPTCLHFVGFISLKLHGKLPARALAAIQKRSTHVFHLHLIFHCVDNNGEKLFSQTTYYHVAYLKIFQHEIPFVSIFSCIYALAVPRTYMRNTGLLC